MSRKLKRLAMAFAIIGSALLLFTDAGQAILATEIGW